MKKLWNLISIIAFVNLLAVVGFGGWLFSSGRMDKEKLKALLAPPPPVDPNAKPAEAPAEPEADLTPTSVKIDASERQLRMEAMSMRRLREEKDQLDKVLEDREQKLTSERTGFESERAAWEASMATTKASKTDEQFRKAVKLLENVPAKQGKEWILELVGMGQADQAVAYLDAMSSFKATGLLKAFKGEEETKVATELLEKLRQRTPSARPAATPDGSAEPTKSADATAPSRSNVPAAVGPRPSGESSAAPAVEGGALKKPADGASTSGGKSGVKTAGKPAEKAPAATGTGEAKRSTESGKPVANSGAEVDASEEGSSRNKPTGSGSKPSGSPGAGAGKRSGEPAAKH